MYILFLLTQGRHLKLNISSCRRADVQSNHLRSLRGLSATGTVAHQPRSETPEWVRHSPVDTTGPASKKTVRSRKASCWVRKHHGVSFETACKPARWIYPCFQCLLRFRGGAARRLQWRCAGQVRLSVLSSRHAGKPGCTSWILSEEEGVRRSETSTVKMPSCSSLITIYRFSVLCLPSYLTH